MCHGKQVVIDGNQCTVHLREGKHSPVLELLDSVTGSLLYAPTLDIRNDLLESDEVLIHSNGAYESLLLQLEHQDIIFPKIHTKLDGFVVDICHIL